MEKLFGGIELGGTKIILAIGDASGKIHEKLKIPTTKPEENMPQMIDFFKKHQAKNVKISALGIASFGPIFLNPKAPQYGYLAKSVKPFWGNFNLVKPFQEALSLPIVLDTDVNAATLAEHLWGAGKNANTIVYWTIGTGIGAGVVINNKIMHGLLHSEIGHSFVPHDKTTDPFKGVCPCHKDCLEGLASGTAMMKRWNLKKATDLPEKHPGWDMEADYLAYGMANAIFFLSPNKIIIGGGVMNQKELIAKIRKKTLEKLNGFIPSEEILKKIDTYIVSPSLGEDSGICGAIALVCQSLRHNDSSF